MTMRNSDLKIIYASSSSPTPPRIVLPPEAEAHISILINDIVDPLEVRMEICASASGGRTIRGGVGDDDDA